MCSHRFATSQLLTHNFLACHIKGVKDAYPFLIEATKVEVRDADYDPDFLRKIFPRIQWPAFLAGASSVSALKAKRGSKML